MAAHAAGVGAATAIDPFPHGEQIDQLGDAGVAAGAIEMVEVALQGKQFAAGEDLVDRHLLGDVPQLAPHAAGIGQGVETGDPHQAGIGRQQGAEDAQSRGLARPVRTEQAVEATGRNAQAKVVESLNHRPPATAAVALADVLQLNQAR
jgi:hypothetical protein